MCACICACSGQFNCVFDCLLDLVLSQVLQPDQPELYAWRGAARLARDLDSGRSSSSNSKEGAGTGTGRMVSRAEYLEHGHFYCNEKFAAPLS